MKNIKNITSAVFAAAAISCLTSGCGSSNSDMSYASNSSATSLSSSQSVSSTPDSSGDETTTNTPIDSAPLQSLQTGSMPENQNTGTNSMTVAQRAKEAIVKAYGDSYLPNMAIPEENLESEFGLTPDMYDEIVAEMPTIGFHPDRLVIVKPKEGKEDAVENALNNAKKRLTESAAQYPANLAKINACKILEEDDYYCFMLLGEPDDTGENDESAAQFAEQQVQIGVKAFENFFEQYE